MDERLKDLMQDLGNAINESLSDSDRIAEAIGEIKRAGYDVFLVLEATIGFNKREEGEDGEIEADSAEIAGELPPAKPEPKIRAKGGKLVLNYGKHHYEDWGAPGDTLQVGNVVPTVSGRYLLQLDAGNGAGPVSTGITCGVKTVEVWQGATLAGAGVVLMS